MRWWTIGGSAEDSGPVDEHPARDWRVSTEPESGAGPASPTEDPALLYGLRAGSSFGPPSAAQTWLTVS